jgi:hypothetical protein
MATPTTSRVVFDQVRNVLDYLEQSELVVYANAILLQPDRVSWVPSDRLAPFLISAAHPSIDQYVSWLRAGHYSALLFDGSLLQITYRITDRTVSAHRLAYVPCPYDLDEELVRSGEPMEDVVDLYRNTDATLRSAVRFDFSPTAASKGHPATHLTFNSVDCRIGCVAPLHVLRFVDFVFRHFYAAHREAHQSFFEVAATAHIGARTLTEAEQTSLHATWDLHSASDRAFLAGWG